MLKEFGTRLQHQIRSADIVARLAGDEFVVLAEGIQDVRELRALAGKIVDAVRAGSGAFLHGHTYQAHPVACAAALEVQRTSPAWRRRRRCRG